MRQNVSHPRAQPPSIVRDGSDTDRHQDFLSGMPTSSASVAYPAHPEQRSNVFSLLTALLLDLGLVMSQVDGL
jgi:hypothetical protein